MIDQWTARVKAAKRRSMMVGAGFRAVWRGLGGDRPVDYQRESGEALEHLNCDTAGYQKGAARAHVTVAETS